MEYIISVCSICGNQLDGSFFNYPNSVCCKCELRAQNINGKEPYSDTVNDYGDNPVFIDGNKCWRRYKFGGYITMLDRYNYKSFSEFYDNILKLNNKQNLEFENLINFISPKKRINRPIKPIIDIEEKRLFLLAINGNAEKKSIVIFGNPKEPERFDAFFLRDIGKGPYHIFELSKNNNTTNMAREWITHIAALTKLYFEYDYPLDCMKFEYQYKYGDHNFPMDIVVFNKNNQELLYVEVKKREKEIKDLLNYLETHKAPLIEDKDRGKGVKNPDEIRKSKYLRFSKIRYLWLICPENLKIPEKNFYEVVKKKSTDKILLKEMKSGLEYIKNKISN